MEKEKSVILVRDDFCKFRGYHLLKIHGSWFDWKGAFGIFQKIKKEDYEREKSNLRERIFTILVNSDTEKELRILAQSNYDRLRKEGDNDFANICWGRYHLEPFGRIDSSKTEFKIWFTENGCAANLFIGGHHFIWWIVSYVYEKLTEQEKQIATFMALEQEVNIGKEEVEKARENLEEQQKELNRLLGMAPEFLK